MLYFLVKYLPSSESINGRYVDPFVGGGSVFFFVNPQRALLSDINPDLINLYRGIQSSPAKVWHRYKSFGRDKTEYHRVRDAFHSKSLADQAARLLFLNRTCFKGMWRHNLNGEFNVGYGGQSRRWVICEDNLRLVAGRLRKARIIYSDFEVIIRQCTSGDFLFLDPPYRPGEREQINDHYVGQQFTFSDYSRLAKALKQAKKRGVRWALTTSSHPDIVHLFGGNYLLNIPYGTGRKPGITVENSGEVLITSYRTKGSEIL